MGDSAAIASRNLFEIDNARNMSVEEVVETFVPTQSFWRLLSSKNHIVCGARGSGKTVLMKMLGHDHLSRFSNPDAKRIIDSRKFVGIYVPTKIEWVSALKNKPWKDEAEAELFFQWRLNVATCMRFLVTLKSCLRVVDPNEITRARLEIVAAREIGAVWSEGEFTGNSLDDLEKYLMEIEYLMQTQLARRRVTGSLRPNEQPAGMVFFSELFVPLRRAIAIASKFLGFDESTNWLVCLDEAEFLDDSQQRILNTHLRAESGNVSFKISTMPYHHKTVDTNADAALSVGHDFEYLYIDRDLIRLSPSGDDAGESAAFQILQRRAARLDKGLDATTWMYVLGPSPLLDPSPAEWRSGSRMMASIEKFGEKGLVSRAHRLSNSKAFRDQISRKLKPAIILREAVARAKGNRALDVYSGARLAIRCSDANPRRLIRIFNSFLLQARQSDGSLKKISANNQTTILSQFSESVLNRTLSHPRVGANVFDLLNSIGAFAFTQLHLRPLVTDQASGIEIDSSISSDEWDAIKAAVGLGLLFPQTTPSKGDPMPQRAGAFHIAYVLAPHFKILPRRGKPRKLSVIVTAARDGEKVPQRKPKSSPQLDFPLVQEDE